MGILETRQRLVAVAAVAGLAVALTACGTETGNDGFQFDTDTFEVPSSPTDGNGEGGAAEGTLSVVSPTPDETVSVPFQLQVETDVELGAIEDELHHVHIWFDDPSGNGHVLREATSTLDGVTIEVPDGGTTLIVHLHTYDHDLVGDPIEIPLTVDNGTNNGGYGDNDGYDYGDDNGGDDNGGYGY